MTIILLGLNMRARAVRLNIQVLWICLGVNLLLVAWLHSWLGFALGLLIGCSCGVGLGAAYETQRALVQMLVDAIDFRMAQRPDLES
jgi:hypothetical protein